MPNQPTSQPARQSVTFDDLFQLEFLQDGQFSPDGQHVAYVVQTSNTESETDHAAIYLHTLASGETRRLTSGEAKDSTPRWSPDGKSLAFFSTRSGKNQLYVIAADGGEAQVLTTLPQGVSDGPAWSPDGQQIAFTALSASTPTDRQRPYRITRAIYRFDKLGYLEPAQEDIYVISRNGGEAKALTQDTSLNSAPTWSPDGSKVLYLANLFPDSHQISATLRTVTLGGAIQDLLGDWGFAAAATWVDDQRVALIGNPQGVPIGTQDNLWMVDVTGSTPECRTAQLDYKVGGALQMDMPARSLRTARLFVDTASDVAYVQVQRGGTVNIYRVALAGAESCTPVITGDRTCCLMHGLGDQLLYQVSTMADPLQLYCAKIDGTQEQALTQLNAARCASWGAPRVEHLLFPGEDGVEVEGWIMLPEGGSAPYPTILYIHGGPHSAFGHIFSFDFRLLTSAGYAVLFINQRASTGYGDAFATAIKGAWGQLDYTDLMAGVDYAIAQGYADGDQLGCCGLSGGGNLSCWIVGQTPRFKAAVPENPVTNWHSFYGVSDIGPWFAVEQLGGHPHEIPEIYTRCSPITYAHHCTTPTLLIQGEQDWRCPAEQSEQFYTILKVNGCPVEMVRLPGSAHAGSIEGTIAVRRAQNEALLGWLNHYVRGESLPTD